MLICGIDEAGRGPLAGPVVAAAVVFEKGFNIENVNDSKVLKESEREKLYFRIIDNCVEYKIFEIDNTEIDRTNILQATMRAMYLTLKDLKSNPEKYLIDGNYFKLPGNKQLELNFETIVHGDAKIFEISCASILAKVTRDNIMRGYHIRFPEYNFGKHKGYATPEHYKNIDKYGITEIHRKSFLKNILTKDNI